MPKSKRHVTAGRIGGLTNAARHDPKEMTKAAMDGYLAKWEREADPNGELDPKERERRAALLRRAHMVRISQLAAKARGSKKGAA